jgi:acetyl esterase/lipase
MTRTLVAFSFVLLIPLVSLAQETKSAPTPPAGVSYEPDIEFGKGGDVALQLDLARPEKSTGKAPCIVVIHGGGWRGGNRKVHIPQIFEFAKRGYVAATIQYRLVPAARFPSQIEDVKCAVRFLRANADKYGLDPERIGAIGFSAGGHLSMMLGVMDKGDGLEGEGGNPDQSSKVQAVISFFGPTDLSAGDYPGLVVGMINDLVGKTPEEDAEIRKKASPVTYVDKDDAPILMFQGTKDRLVPHTQAYVMADAMTKAGQRGRVELILGADHGWGGQDLLRTAQETFDFFALELKHPK